MLNTPVLLIVFNRPSPTQQVFDAIRAAKPKQLFVAADGPRKAKEGEVEKCAEVRKITTHIDWDCEIKTLFSEENQGCGIGPYNAISWFFQHVEKGVILEDDCLPDQTFFTFCEETLDYYADNDKVMHISGNNFSFDKRVYKESYLFTKYFTAWGWATWRRAWQAYDFDIKDLDLFLEKGILNDVVNSKKQYKYWVDILEMVRNGQRADIWDYQWLFCCWKNHGYAITPTSNLVTNIGFGEDATHTKGESLVSFVPTVGMSVLIHPQKLERNVRADNRIFNYFFAPPQTLNRIRDIARAILPVIVNKGLRKVRRRIFPKLK